MDISGIFKKLFREPESAAAAPARPTAPSTPATRQWISNPWHAVSVIPGARSCAAAQCAVGGRYLSSEAPALPLQGCDQSSCTCRFKHHEDRRHEPRRSADVWNSGRMWTGSERRERRGRRATDLA